MVSQLGGAQREMASSQPMSVVEREMYARGRKHFDEGEIDPALEAFSSLLNSRENFADIHYMVGILFERKGDLDAAAESLRKAIRLNPQYAEALLALASIHERRGDFDRSRELAERAASVSNPGPNRLDPTTRGKLANLQAKVGDAYAEAGEKREAIEAYRKALDRCPNFHDIRHRLGVVLREAGLPDQATREFKRILRANPGLVDARIQLGLTHYSLGRAQEALAEWDRVAADCPGREDIELYRRLARS
ncbi:MAG: tetratricopeptide repeat protein, partial [bacterium]|nr:tetratricopeptide repeat protein [bacterium]